MIEIGKSYIFRYRVNAKGETSNEKEMCIRNDGLECDVVCEKFKDEHGTVYEVESCLGDEFFAYECELDEIKED